LRILNLSDLNELHVLITCAVEDKGYSATVTEINDYVVKAITDIRSDAKLTSKEPRKAIISVLSKYGQYASIFTRDPANYIRWKCTEYHPWLNCSIEEKEQKLNELTDLILNVKDIDLTALAMEYHLNNQKEPLSRR
jgi:hypothetical protein